MVLCACFPNRRDIMDNPPQIHPKYHRFSTPQSPPRWRPGPAPLPGSKAPRALNRAAPVQRGHLVERRGRSAAAATAHCEPPAESAAEFGRAQRWAQWSGALMEGEQMLCLSFYIYTKKCIYVNIYIYIYIIHYNPLPLILNPPLPK